MTNIEEDKVIADEKANDDHPLFQVIKTSDAGQVVENVRNFFEIDNVSVEIKDSSGMTPMMHACWKGNLDLAKFLIKQVC